jgi:hypothetical protein
LLLQFKAHRRPFEFGVFHLAGAGAIDHPVCAMHRNVLRST